MAILLIAVIAILLFQDIVRNIKKIDKRITKATRLPFGFSSYKKITKKITFSANVGNYR